MEGVPNPLWILWDTFYGVAASLTGIVGLTPVHLGIIACCLLAVAFIVQIALALTGKRGWTLHDLPEDTGT